MKQKWPILIFSALLTAFIVLAGIWGNAQFERLHSGSVLTAEHAAQGIALDGWRQEDPGQWHFTFTVGEDIHNLRSKIEPDPAKPVYLKNVWGKGYVFQPDGGKV